MSLLLLIYAAAVFHSLAAVILLTIGTMLLSMRDYRMWIAQQSHLMFAALRNIRSKEIIWKKESK
jgi:hypothetical protein